MPRDTHDAFLVLTSSLKSHGKRAEESALIVRSLYNCGKVNKSKMWLLDSSFNDGVGVGEKTTGRGLFVLEVALGVVDNEHQPI